MVKTNKTIRKRRPGGGRKPKGAIHSKSEVFTTRITAETRAAIEAEAKRSGQSISQAAERLLVIGMETRRRRQNNRSLRALCFLIEQLALRVGSARWMDIARFRDPDRRKAIESLQDEWRTDPFRYKAFTIAVQSLLEALKPQGEIKPPFSPEAIAEAVSYFGSDHMVLEIMKNEYASPERLGAFQFTLLWQELNRGGPPSEGQRRLWGSGNWVAEMMREEFYGVQEAINDLALEPRSKEDEK